MVLNVHRNLTMRLIRDGEKGVGVGEEGDYYTYRYTVSTGMTPALSWAVMRAPKPIAGRLF